MLPHEVLIANAVYLTVLLAYGHPLNILPAMVSCLQGGLQVLLKSFCYVEAMKDDEGRNVIDRNGEHKLKIQIPGSSYHTPTWWNGIVM